MKCPEVPSDDCGLDNMIRLCAGFLLVALSVLSGTADGRAESTAPACRSTLDFHRRPYGAMNGPDMESLIDGGEVTAVNRCIHPDGPVGIVSLRSEPFSRGKPDRRRDVHFLLRSQNERDCIRTAERAESTKQRFNYMTVDLWDDDQAPVSQMVLWSIKNCAIDGDLRHYQEKFGYKPPYKALPPIRGIPAGAVLHAIGIYEPGKSGTIRIKVRRMKSPAILALSSYRAVRWVIESEPGTRIAAVILSGYERSDVSGIGSETLIDRWFFEGGGSDRHFERPFFYFHEDDYAPRCHRKVPRGWKEDCGFAHFDHNLTESLDRLRELTSRKPRTIQFTSIGETFEIGPETVSSRVLWKRPIEKYRDPISEEPFGLDGDSPEQKHGR